MIGAKETIHVSWATNGLVDNYFAVSLLDIFRDPAYPIGSFNSIQGTGLLSKTRNLMVKHFLEQTKDDWLLMVDSDQFISLPSFEKLLAGADKDIIPILSGLVFSSPSQTEIKPYPCIFDFDGEDNIAPVYDYPEDKIIQVYSAGTGCLLIHRRVLEHLRELHTETHGPDWVWFQDGPIGNNIWLSEDLMFAEKINDAGYQIHAHTGAVIPHHKSLWITDAHFRASRAPMPSPDHQS